MPPTGPRMDENYPHSNSASTRPDSHAGQPRWTAQSAACELLGDAGFSPFDAARAAYLLTVYVFGSMALEVADVATPGPLPPESQRIAVRRSVFAATPTEQFPRSAAAARVVASYISTEQYIWGLHRVLDGIAGCIAEHPPASG